MTREIRMTPSILNADREHLGEEISRIAAVSDLIHLDVMDNIFVPNFTFDFDRASAIIKASPVPIDSHLMVAEVDEIAIAWCKKRKLQGRLGGPVGQEWGSPDCDLE